MTSASSIRIWSGQLEVLDGARRRPLAQVEPRSDVHGELRIEIGGRAVPRLGYFGPTDVCIPTWLGVLWQASCLFAARENGSYTFDEGEQGQPAFVFGRSGTRGYLTIAPSRGGQTAGEPEWQAVPFLARDFTIAHAAFRDALFAELRAAAPGTADDWILLHDPALGGSAWPP